MKSKCDGQRPKCGRCAGYGYPCVYSGGRIRRRTAETPVPADALPPPNPPAVAELRGFLDEYEELVQRLLPHVACKDQQQEVQSSHETLKQKVKEAMDDIVSLFPLPSSSDLCFPLVASSGGQGQGQRHGQDSTPGCSPENQRYLGEVSDVHFFNLIKQLLQTREVSAVVDPSFGFDNYEQEGEMPPGTMSFGALAEPPGLDEASGFVQVYFSTVHLAYPFLLRSSFQDLNRFRQPAKAFRDGDKTELAIFYVLCAIGAYYTSFPGQTKGLERHHEAYFQWSLTLAVTSERSTNQVSLLLAQCFYFLAVSRTDNCWAALGQAVRMAQSIGLHVESSGTGVSAMSLMEVEKRRRIWYSIYVLDRLVALQLGRPPAIHDDDCNVPMPSLHADADVEGVGGGGDEDDECRASNSGQTEQGISEGDYFIAVINFSRIVGHVLRSMYSPRQGQPTAKDTFRTRELDMSLMDWKAKLPRRLRFDLGHAFDQNYVFKRQRNMLAVKFHHLRALIHRPYLCYPLLRHLDEASPDLPQADWTLVCLYEKTCIAEARETARLLHGVSSEQELVQDFPWWQMISCLTCAGSILLVSSIFSQRPGYDGLDFDTHGLHDHDADSLHDDAETCLKMFEALSINSPSAKVARDMMDGLKKHGREWKDRLSPTSAFQQTQATATALQGPALPSHPMPELVSTGVARDMVLSELALAPMPSHWPTDIEDAMVWSAQFLNAFQDGDDTGQE